MCSDKTLYTGVAKDVGRRVHEHNTSDRLGARYTRARRPVILVYTEACEDRSQASRREVQIKRLSRREKEDLISSGVRRAGSC